LKSDSWAAVWVSDVGRNGMRRSRWPSRSSSVDEACSDVSVTSPVAVTSRPERGGCQVVRDGQAGGRGPRARPPPYCRPPWAPRFRRRRSSPAAPPPPGAAPGAPVCLPSPPRGDVAGAVRRAPACRPRRPSHTVELPPSPPPDTPDQHNAQRTPPQNPTHPTPPPPTPLTPTSADDRRDPVPPEGRRSAPFSVHRSAAAASASDDRGRPPRCRHRHQPAQAHIQNVNTNQAPEEERCPRSVDSE